MSGKQGRIAGIDAIRGFSLILMVAYHLLYDLHVFLGAPAWIVYNPAFRVLQPFFAGVFITLAGVSSRFSRSNVRRGLKVLGVSLLVTLATYWIGSPVWFGILQFLGVAMVFYGLTEALWRKADGWIMPLVCLVGVLLSNWLLAGVNPVDAPYLFPLGFVQAGFWSSDYFPILPWLFVFLFGTWLGRLVREDKLPDWFYRWNPPFFPAVGRKSLLIYILHQPILYALVQGVAFLWKGGA